MFEVILAVAGALVGGGGVFAFQKVKSANAKNDSTKILTEAKRKSAEILERANEKALRLTEEAKKEEILSNITAATEYADCSDADIFIEAIAEDMETKKNTFAEIEKIAKEDAIMATNTSSLSITEVASTTTRPERVIGMHFFNPVPAMKLVEVIKGQMTDQDIFNKVFELSKAVGKVPVEIEEAPGFVVNRILIPMINEAVGILADGVAKKEDIDEAMKLGANHPMGPLALADLIGLDVCLAIMEVLYSEFADSKYRPHPLLRKMVRANLLGRKTKAGFYNY